MRYVLTESEQGNITLEQELAFMNNYIDLMRLRISEKVKISVDFRPHSSEIMIPPMIFISFIENAFKHGISYRQDSFINISLKTTETDLTFICINSKVRVPVAQKDECQGIGLENVKRRLLLLYPENHSLQIEENDDTFNVILILNLFNS
jgi:LytS/YehU family sensor histidine kinase